MSSKQAVVGAAFLASTAFGVVIAQGANIDPSSLNIYFGNLHSHTADSDGKGTPTEAYTYARDVAKLDFLAITDHNHLYAGEHATQAERDARYAGPAETALIPTANRFTKDGSFVALYGVEFSSMSKGNHVNVFDVANVPDVPNGKFDNLLVWMKAHPDSTGQMPFLQINHPGLGPPNKGILKNEYGRDDFGDDVGWVKNIGGVTPLIEIANGEPLPNGRARRPPQVMERFYRLFLQEGFHVAPTGDQDNHTMTWGDVTDTRTAILAPTLTKTALLSAIRARHVYATEDKNLKIIAKIDTHLCGDIVDDAKYPNDVTISYQITDLDEPNADYSIDVVSGTTGGIIGTVVKTVTTTGNTPAGTWQTIEGINVKSDGQYIYLRFVQKDPTTPDEAWTAPIWFETKK